MAKPAVPGRAEPTGRDRPVEHRDAFVTGGAYGVLFVLGAIEAIMGSFGYSWMVGPVPAAALGCCAALLVTCLAAGWAMRSLAGEPGPDGPDGPDGREDDLFAGVAADPEPQRIPDGAAAGHAG